MAVNADGPIFSLRDLEGLVEVLVRGAAGDEVPATLPHTLKLVN